jgi:uncharacterized protein YwqG
MQATRVGGWPFWVQSPTANGLFVAQVTSEEESDLMFGDAGSLYVFLDAKGAFSVEMQCY